MAALAIIKKAVVSAGMLAVVCGIAVAEPLRVDGTGDGLEMLRAVAALYRAEQGGDVLLPASIGSGGGIAAVVSGAAPLARIARPLKPTEVEAGLIALPIARIPTAIIASRSAGVSKLTSDQLASIYRGDVTDWSEVGGSSGKIKVVRREDADSSLLVLRETMPGWKDLEITSKSKTAVTTQDAIETVSQVEGTIGFAPFSTSLVADVVVLKIDGRAPTDPGYPSAVLLQFAFKEGAMTQQAQDFVDFVGSDQSLRLMSAFGAVPQKRS